MSSFISSLLNELGLRSRPNHNPAPQDEAESPRDDNTDTSDIDNSDNLERRKQREGSGPISGDVASLPSPPFFATLPKDMSGRTPEPEVTRPAPRNSTFGTRSISLPATRQSDAAQATERRIDLGGGHGVQFQHADSSRLPGDPPRTNTVSPPEVGDASGNSPDHSLDVDGFGRVSLPEDDGMGWLRNKIHAIRDLNLSSNEKARMIHDLMTERYNSVQKLSPTPFAALSPTLSPSRMDNSGNQPIPGLQQPSEPSPRSPVLVTQDSLQEKSFSLTPEDLTPTYVPKTEPESPVVEAGEAADEDPDTEELAETSLGCQHYMRNVKLQCFTCKKWYTCRFCHDEAEDHHLIRKDTENMLCMLCGHPQPAAQNCSKCNEQTAQYYCDICKLWDNDSKKSIYHCGDCGICRIGQGLGKDFFHCKTCCVCLPISIEDTHRCIERSTQCDCPICGDYMFTSPETVVVMRCGHSIHNKCLSEYSKTSFRCPICSKTITNMESTFRNLDRTIESQPMPSDFKDTKGLVYCNDCGAKSVVKYHWLGLKCDLCESYNTAQIRLLQGDVSGVLEEEGVSEPTPRPRSSTLNARDEPASSLDSLHLNVDPTPPSRLSVPGPVGPDRRFVSYNMTHGRAISPVVSNYFGLPPERESDKPSSLPFFSSFTRGDNENDYGALNFLSKKLRDRYGFLGRDNPENGGVSEAEEEDEATAESSESSDNEDDGDDDEDDDGVEYIDIFGHR